MPQQESYIDRAETLLSPEVVTMGKQCIEEFFNVQTELLERLQQTNQHWLERVQSEVALASKFAAKLTAAHSVPEAMTTCQEWTGRQIEMIAEDSCRGHPKVHGDGRPLTVERLVVEPP